VTTHTTACRRARTGKHSMSPQDRTPQWPLMVLLSSEEQQSVLDCAHPAHDSVRRYLFSRPVPTPDVQVR